MGLHFIRINVEKNTNITKDSKIEINNKFKITDISHREPPVKGAGEVVRIDFNFTVDYSPKIGKISLDGYLLYLEKSKLIKTALDEWNKNKKVNQELLSKIIQPALYRCHLKALLMCQEVNLPPHLPIIPKPIPRKKAEEYIG